MALGRVDPLAQTFYVQEASGIYITKIGVFFSQVSSTAPITLELRNAEQGAPNSIEVIPDSMVVKTASQMSSAASADATIQTIFEFDEPIYLEGNRPYAMTFQSPARNEYFLWAAQTGDFNLGTTESRVTQNPQKGALFKSQEGLIYLPSAGQDLKYVIYRAAFEVAEATAVFRTAEPPRVSLSNNPLWAFGDSAEVTVTHNRHGFLVNDRVNIRGLTGGTTYNGVLGSSINGTRIITKSDGYGYTFAADSAFDSDAAFGGVSVTSSKQIKFDTLQLQTQDFKPGSTLVNYSGDLTTSTAFAGSQTPYARTTGINLRNNADTKLSQPHVIATDSNESVFLTSHNESGIINAVLRAPTGGNKISPFVDLQRTHLLLTQNVIDNPDSDASTGYNIPINYVAETDPKNGSALAKHIAKPIALAQSASGLKILVGANIPAEAGVSMYYRTVEEGSDSDILERNWVLATADEVPPKSINDKDFNEYRFTIGGTFANTLPEFNQYQVKAVMTSTNSAKVPRITDLRTIALGADQAF
tara:strand:- start:420 stop:2009 length:1590 start_codon:yes stop_codon:yes gene_type:complete